MAKPCFIQLFFFFDPAWLGTGIPPIVALLIVALSIVGGNLGFIVTLVGLAMAGFGALRKQSVRSAESSPLHEPKLLFKGQPVTLTVGGGK
jgi:hypothetical protein